MTEPDEKQQLEEVIKTIDFEWIYSVFGGGRGPFLDWASVRLREFRDEYLRRFGDIPNLPNLAQTDPYKAMAFLDPDTLRSSVEIKIMVWRILIGGNIKKVEFTYESGETNLFSATIQSPDGSVETYLGQSERDFLVIRHFGTIGTDDRVFLDGYHAMRRG